MTKKKTNAFTAGIIVLVALVAVYGILLTQEAGAKTGVLELQITDAPSELNISKAVVTLSSIEVHMAGSDEEMMEDESNESNETNATIEGNEESSEAGWKTIVEGPVSYDLLEIVDVKEFLGSEVLEVGKYTQVRLHIDNALVTIDGEEYNLTIPSGKLRLNHPFTIEENETTTLTIDFDANASIKRVGSSNRYILHPVIGIMTE